MKTELDELRKLHSDFKQLLEIVDRSIGPFYATEAPTEADKKLMKAIIAVIRVSHTTTLSCVIGTVVPLLEITIQEIELKLTELAST